MLKDLFKRSESSISGLDALRSAAILLVFSDHFSYYFREHTTVETEIGALAPFRYGWTGVDLFFVLSGFLIGTQLLEEQQRTSGIRIGHFMYRRGMRIWPYYFAFIAFSAVFVGASSRLGYWPDVLFLSNYFSGGISGGWSLSTEEQFYLAAPVLLLLVGSVHQKWGAFAVPITALLLLPIARWIETRGLPSEDLATLSEYILFYPIHTHSDGLAAGVLIAWLALHRPGFASPLGFVANLRLPAIIFCAGVLLRAVSDVVFSFSAIAAIYSAMIIFALRDGSRVSKFTASVIFLVTSRLSFAMYLNHFLVLKHVLPTIAEWTNVGQNSEIHFVTCYVLALLISMGIGATTFILIERPFLEIRDAGRALRREQLSGRSK
jgi:peptidoglycan/LPS O-acetylase OafA/YrhL